MIVYAIFWSNPTAHFFPLSSLLLYKFDLAPSLVWMTRSSIEWLAAMEWIYIYICEEIHGEMNEWQNKENREQLGWPPPITTTRDEIWQNENIWATLIRICRKDIDAEARSHSTYSNWRIFVSDCETRFNNKQFLLIEYFPIQIYYFFSFDFYRTFDDSMAN